MVTAEPLDVVVSNAPDPTRFRYLKLIRKQSRGSMCNLMPQFQSVVGASCAALSCKIMNAKAFLGPEATELRLQRERGLCIKLQDALAVD